MPIKIFDLAKEVGIGAIEVVQKLNSSGMSVRNHMATLTDGEEGEARKILFPEPDKKVAKKKKKVAKKKVTKKKVTAKAAGQSASEKVEEKTPEDAADTPKTVKRRIVVRRKASAKEETTSEEVEGEVSETLQSAPSEEITQVSEDGRQNLKTRTGLTIVQNAPVAKKVEVVEEKKANSTEPLEKKPHRFTPVFIPEKKKESETTATKEGAPKTFTSPDENAEKKKVGLAAFMAKNKNVNRSRDLTQQRADEELKTYSALNSLGRPIYSAVGRKKNYMGPSAQTSLKETKESKKYIIMHNSISILEVAKKLKIKFKELRDKCLDLNLLVKQDDEIGEQLALLICDRYGFNVRNEGFSEATFIEQEEEKEDRSHLPIRSPVVTVMGHVDHGKTTLIDYIRNEKVVDGEAGGITQHIGAYSVTTGNKSITFLDTPGHAAFGAMRQRGADITDIVILVVAADDGVMPQTKESIKYCQKSGVPIIVAVNKCDKDDANPDRVKQELVEFNITPEEWGGETMFCNVSALQGDGIDELLAHISLLSEMQELHEDPKGKAEGIVIESKVEQGRGPVATILVQKGTLKKGDSVVVGETYGRARNLLDHTGKVLKSAGPSTPVQILGLAECPSPGDILNTVKNERESKKVAENRILERKGLENVPEKKKVSLEDFFATAVAENEQKVLKLIVRSDVQGSFEAIKNALETLGNSEVKVKIIGGGVGAINDNDVSLASAGEGASIIGFNMRPITSARRLADDHGVEIKTYSIIYEVINDVKLALEGLLDPEFTEKFIGRAEVRETFSIPKIGTIAGTAVIDGKIEKGCNIRLLREGKILHDGKLSSLKRFKDDVKEVGNGYECGMALEEYNDIKIDDVFEAYILEEKKRVLDDFESVVL